jgi:hypothetical protein
VSSAENGNGSATNGSLDALTATTRAVADRPLERAVSFPAVAYVFEELAEREI